MDSTKYEIVLDEVKKGLLAEHKLKAVACVQGFFSGEQVVRLLKSFPGAECQLKALRILQQKMFALSTNAAVSILGGFTFSKDKVHALEVIASSIRNPLKSAPLEDHFRTFADEQKKCRAILEQASRLGCRAPMQSYSGNSGNPYPQGRPSRSNPLFTRDTLSKDSENPYLRTRGVAASVLGTCKATPVTFNPMRPVPYPIPSPIVHATFAPTVSKPISVTSASGITAAVGSSAQPPSSKSAMPTPVLAHIKADPDAQPSVIKQSTSHSHSGSSKSSHASSTKPTKPPPGSSASTHAYLSPATSTPASTLMPALTQAIQANSAFQSSGAAAGGVAAECLPSAQYLATAGAVAPPPNYSSFHGVSQKPFRLPSSTASQALPSAAPPPYPSTPPVSASLGSSGSAAESFLPALSGSFPLAQQPYHHPGATAVAATTDTSALPSAAAPFPSLPANFQAAGGGGGAADGTAPANAESRRYSYGDTHGGKRHSASTDGQSRSAPTPPPQKKTNAFLPPSSPASAGFAPFAVGASPTAASHLQPSAAVQEMSSRKNHESGNAALAAGSAVDVGGSERSSQTVGGSLGRSAFTALPSPAGDTGISSAGFGASPYHMPIQKRSSSSSRHRETPSIMQPQAGIAVPSFAQYQVSGGYNPQSLLPAALSQPGLVPVYPGFPTSTQAELPLSLGSMAFAGQQQQQQQQQQQHHHQQSSVLAAAPFLMQQSLAAFQTQAELSAGLSASMGLPLAVPFPSHSAALVHPALAAQSQQQQQQHQEQAAAAAAAAAAALGLAYMGQQSAVTQDQVQMQSGFPAALGWQ
uniref:Proline and serine-rich protein 1 isoform X1 n=1 Tax=Petromyzon marinus TaxID=7757 RepID=A0AAJ7XE24_PETMA|nr:proline and serine-rich protein 1 isoform X1 [Petromyzon marinus]